MYVLISAVFCVSQAVQPGPLLFRRWPTRNTAPAWLPPTKGPGCSATSNGANCGAGTSPAPWHQHWYNPGHDAGQHRPHRRCPGCRQDYANFCLTACIIIAVILVTVLAEPHVVPYVIWDGRIAYPVRGWPVRSGDSPGASSHSWCTNAGTVTCSQPVWWDIWLSLVWQSQPHCTALGRLARPCHRPALLPLPAFHPSLCIPPPRPLPSTLPAVQLNSELNTIPSWVAVFVPLVMLALTIGLGEFLAARRMHNSVTDAVSTAVYFFLDGVQVGWRGAA